MAGHEELAALLQAVARGDESAFRRLWDVAAPVLMGLCLRLMRRRQAAEDVLQESFVRIWQKAHRFDPALGEPLGWMAAVARNTALDQLRRERRTNAMSLEDAPDAAHDPVGPDLARLEGSDLARCLARLPDGPRRAILLAYHEGLTHSELAQRLEVPLGTAKSWIRRGLMELKECLDA